MSHPTLLGQTLWNYRSVLRDDSLFYGDHPKQLTFLHLLKMADEQARRRATLLLPIAYGAQPDLCLVTGARTGPR